MNDKNKKPTQAARLLEYLRSHKGITQREAINELGCYRLAARISDLKRNGHRVKRKMVTVMNRWGERVSVAEYSLIGGEWEEEL